MRTGARIASGTARLKNLGPRPLWAAPRPAHTQTVEAQLDTHLGRLMRALTLADLRAALITIQVRPGMEYGSAGCARSAMRSLATSCGAPAGGGRPHIQRRAAEQRAGLALCAQGAAHTSEAAPLQAPDREPRRHATCRLVVTAAPERCRLSYRRTFPQRVSSAPLLNFRLALEFYRKHV